MISLIERLFRKSPPRPLYALLLQQQQQGTVVQAVGPDVPLLAARRMLQEALGSIDEAIERQAAQQGKR